MVLSLSPFFNWIGKIEDLPRFYGPGGRKASIREEGRVLEAILWINSQVKVLGFLGFQIQGFLLGRYFQILWKIQFKLGWNSSF